MTSTLGILKIVVSALEPAERRRWIWLLVLALAAAALETVGAGAVFGLVALVADPASVARLPLAGPALADLASADRVAFIVGLSAALAIFFVAKNGFLYFQIHFQEKTGFETTSRISSTLIRGFLRVDYPFHFRRNSAHMIQTLEYGVNDAVRGALQSSAVMFSEALGAFGIIALLVSTEPLVAAVTLGLLGSLMALTLRLTRKRVAALGAEVRAAQTEVIKATQQSLGAVKELKVLGREEHFCSGFERHHRLRTTAQRRSAVIQHAPRLAMETLMVVGMVIIIAMVAATKADIDAILPTLGIFAYAGFRLQPALNRVVLNLNNIHKSAAAALSLGGDLDRLAAPAAVPFTRSKPMAFERELELDEVSYTYPGTEREVLNGISFLIPRGAAIGVAGPTGSGKSTLIDVLLGLLTPSAGSVRVDGVDISTDPRAWQMKIGYVPQSNYLIDDTLRRNVAFGIADAEIDEAKLAQALSMAQLAEFVASLPEGLETRVGERGISLSGGQRQRVGVARALYHQPELLVFDEATSALDAETEREVSLAIDALSGKKTIILVAHRLSTLRNCQEIILLKDGKVAGRGSPAALASTNEDFRRMVELSSVTIG